MDYSSIYLGSVGIMVGNRQRINSGRYGLFEDVSIEQGNFHIYIPSGVIKRG